MLHVPECRSHYINSHLSNLYAIPGCLVINLQCIEINVFLLIISLKYIRNFESYEQKSVFGGKSYYFELNKWNTTIVSYTNIVCYVCLIPKIVWIFLDTLYTFFQKGNLKKNIFSGKFRNFLN